MPAAHTTLLSAANFHCAHLVPAAGDFIEDDGGEGDYMDLGDDELFGSGAADEAAAGGKGKKRKGSDKGEQRQAQLEWLGRMGAAVQTRFMCSRGCSTGVRLLCHLHVAAAATGCMTAPLCASSALCDPLYG
jgi:hypothetical protein